MALEHISNVIDGVAVAPRVGVAAAAGGGVMALNDGIARGGAVRTRGVASTYLPATYSSHGCFVAAAGGVPVLPSGHSSVVAIFGVCLACVRNDVAYRARLSLLCGLLLGACERSACSFRTPFISWCVV
jgi:hypothetical protein